ncbi:hypothetical protein ACNVED_07420 [Legionella sp. D16C41]|uniref:hypothetical protein n=1 Tax=Legionella sp. D16C41 TaxID=3402688 RepID=UPI003AF79CAF
MKIVGKIELIETEGRTGKSVKKIPNDYFLALKITEIDSKPISTVKSTFEALKPSFPVIKVNDEDVGNLFETYKLAPGMTDVCHLSLAYFVDFRKDRNPENDLDQEKVDTAYEELDGKVISFEINNDCAFQIVSTSKEYKHINTKADVTYASMVGNGRDTILNLLPSQATQNELGQILACVFGSNFKLRNSLKIEIPFHVTIAETNKLNLKLANVNNPSEKLNENSTLTV